MLPISQITTKLNFAHSSSVLVSSLLLAIIIYCLVDETCGNDAAAAPTEPSAQTNDDKFQTETIEREFAHLFNRAAASKRVHLVSEHIRNGHKLMVEEFLDLENWNQFLQFKWNEDDRLREQGKDGENQALRTRKINFIVLNDATRKIVVQYEPYVCDISVTNSTSTPTNQSDAINAWWSLVGDSLALNSDNPKIKAGSRHTLTIQSIMSTNLNSPYLAQIPTENSEAWVFGMAALWLKAQFPGYVEKVKQSESAWRLNLKDSGAILLYYSNEIGYDFLTNDTNNTKLNQPPNNRSSAESDSLNLIELRQLKTTHLIDMINVIVIDFKFSNQLMRDLFKLPIGYRCPENPMLTDMSQSRLYLMDIPVSQMTLFETVATRYATKLDVTETSSTTNVKGLTIATCRHPMNSLASLTMFHIVEDHMKIIRDYHSRIMYKIHLNGTKRGELKQVLCELSQLHIFDFHHSQATNPIEVQYGSTGIELHINEAFWEYLINSRGKGMENGEQVLLNRLEVFNQESKEELVFEIQVPDSYTELVRVLDRQTGKPVARKLSLIRVYERQITDRSTKFKLRHSRVAKLVRIILLVFDYRRQEKLAELRFNLIDLIPLTNLASRAQLFDLSSCYQKNEQSMELIVSYPIEQIRMHKYLEGRSQELINEFYLSSINWSIFEGQLNTTMSLEKRRLGISLNHLRVPKVELLNSPEGGSFRLKLLVLDKASPLHLFDQMVESTFVTNTIEERLLVSNIEQCAHYCQLQNCRLFAFDVSSLECKLSPISVEDQLEENEEVVGGDSMTILRKETSKIYYAPARSDKIDSKAPVLEEASLAELYSYLEHSTGELDPSNNLVTDEPEVEEDAFVTRASNSRAKRDINGDGTQPDKWPLFSFKYTDKSTDPKQAYAPPIRRLLVPSEIRAIRVPLTMDFSLEFQRVKVASAFRSSEIGKTYRIDIEHHEGSENPGGAQNVANERTFIDDTNSILYSLKRLYQIELETCALMCYNIDEWDSKVMAEQSCQSFSYCKSDKGCILMVKTDVKFSGIITANSGVTDEAGQVVLNISSSEQLLTDRSDCLVSRRNYLTEFEGPIRLPLGYKDSDYMKLSSLDSSLDYEWLTVTNIESSEIYEDSQENCAKECNKRNRLGKMCIALDFCINKFLPGYKVNQEITRYQATCDLLLISSDNESNFDSSGSSRSGIVRRARNQLVQQALNTGSANSNNNNNNNKGKANDVGYESNCNRYLVSHLSEFNHIKLRQVSQELANQLGTNKPSDGRLNLDSCALECSIKRDNCLMFEYCSKFNYTSRQLQINCTLFGGDGGGNHKLASNININNNDNEMMNDATGSRDEDEQQGSLSVYSRDCHVYLKKEIDSLEDLLALAKLNATKRLPLFAFEHHELLFYCTIFFIALTIIAYLYYRSTNDYHARLV